MRESINNIIINALDKFASNNSNVVSNIFNPANILFQIETKKTEQNIKLKKNSNNISFQQIYSSNHRKNNGIYYTPEDLTLFIVYNIISFKYFNEKNLSINNITNKILSLNKTIIKDIVFNQTFFDPTCGAGDFLCSVLEVKFKLLEHINKEITEIDYLNICNTIFGNDIEKLSLVIIKERIITMLSDKLKTKKTYTELINILNKNLFNYDFIKNSEQINLKFDYIVGNPPYIEYSKYKDKEILKKQYGNVYADVIDNSLSMLKENAVFSFIVPISYTSTQRMETIRKLVNDSCEKQIILNFSDRPSCLFSNVHQKINFIFAKKGKKDCITYTSNYKYWYKEERKNLFDNMQVVESILTKNNTIVKAGTDIEKSIYKKIATSFKNNIISKQVSLGEKIYLNMRACFWIKAFSTIQKSKEYKTFIFEKSYRNFILCLLNSSAFWLYWIMNSDCWHITTKDLSFFTVPDKLEKNNKFNVLAKKLEKKLDTTKKYVGSVQTDYEYKHKLCLNEINLIDNEIAKIYKFNNEEQRYIKEYALKYRIGDVSNV